VKANLSAFGIGSLFAIGLALSGMTKPSKVVGFLDLFGAWDASLAFVMIGAIAVHLVAHRLIARRTSPLLEARFHLPTRKDIDPRLVVGAGLFGVGWGLGGFCPGPAIVALPVGRWEVFLFVAAMVAGMAIYRLIPMPKPA
jgi:uncharacterized protein